VSPRTPRPSAPGLRLSEQAFQQQVLDLARATGWLAYHTHDSRHSEAGFPDLVLVHSLRRRVIYAELKSDSGHVSPPQQRWIEALETAGAEVHLWQPRFWRAIEAVLIGRPDPRNFAPGPHE